MRTLYFFLEKEFIQMLRQKALLITILLMPTIQLIIMPLAANYSIENISMAVVDNDHSSISTQMINKITSSGHFKLYATCKSNEEAFDLIEDGKVDLYIEIPNNFKRDIVRNHHANLNVQVNAIEGVKASLGSSYLASILMDFSKEITPRFTQVSAMQSTPAVIEVKPVNWYNRYMNYYLFIVPGLLVMLVLGIGLMQTMFNLVNEKETGTIEQLNVTPIKKYVLIIGKMIPYMVLSFIIFAVGNVVGYLFYGIKAEGSYLTVFPALATFLFSLMSFALLLSTYAQTQQQAMSFGFFFMNILNMLSGIFTSIDSMPQWIQYITFSFPVSHFVVVMRQIILKGSTLADISNHILAMLGLGIFYTTWAVLNYHKRS